MSVTVDGLTGIKCGDENRGTGSEDAERASLASTPDSCSSCHNAWEGGTGTWLPGQGLEAQERPLVLVLVRCVMEVVATHSRLRFPAAHRQPHRKIDCRSAARVHCAGPVGGRPAAYPNAAILEGGSGSWSSWSWSLRA